MMSESDRARRIDQYAQGPDRLRQALSRVPDGMVKWRPAPGKWSVHEIVCHAAESCPSADLSIGSTNAR